MNKKRRTCFVVVLGFVLGATPVQADVSIGPDVIVKGTTIEVVGPGPDLQAIIDGIDDADVDNPHLIKLGPGVYTIEPDMTTSTGLKMASFISIMGSGQGVTILKGAVSSGSQDATSAIVSGADNAALTDLSVENTGGNTDSIAIFNFNASPRIEYVIASASGGSINYGVYNDSSSSPTMTHVTATASGGSANIGVYNISSSSPIMTHVTATASGGSCCNSGVYNILSSSPTMVHVAATASSDGNSSGVANGDSDSAPRIENSYLEGGTRGMGFGWSIGTRITNTRIVGGLEFDPSGTQCRDNYDADLNDVTC